MFIHRVTASPFNGGIQQPAAMRFAAARPTLKAIEDDEADEPVDPKAGEPQYSRWFLNRYYEEIFIQAVRDKLAAVHKMIPGWVKELYEVHGDESAGKIIPRVVFELNGLPNKRGEASAQQLTEAHTAFLAERPKTEPKLAAFA